MVCYPYMSFPLFHVRYSYGAPPMAPGRKEVTDLVHACEAIHALLAIGALAPNERDLIEFSGSEMLVKLRFDFRKI